MMIGTVTINPSIDQHILIDRLVKDDAIRAREIRRDPGGKGINVSRVIKELGGSLPPGVPGDFYARLITALQQRGAQCLLDADDEPLKLGLQAKPYLIKPNEHEFARLVGRPLPTEQSLIKAASEVIAGGVQVVAITLGRKGAVIVTQDVALHVTSPDVEVKSKVGAGDSFLAGFVFALSQGQSLESAVRLGTAAGTAAVMHEGTQLCRREDVEQLVGQITVKPLTVTVPAPSRSPTHTVQDVVCGMDVDPALSGFSSTHQGTVYRFCSLKCRQQFEADPGRFVSETTTHERSIHRHE